MTYDILITSGTILDGTGAKPWIGDIGIQKDRIAAVGNLQSAGGAVHIDAQGKYVAPGFIDITNHSDTHLTLFKYPGADSLIMQGVTTIIGGNCGASLAPLASHTAIQAIRKWADPSQINVNWNTFDEYLKQLDELHPGVNVGSFVGYGTLRRGIINDEVRLLTPDERDAVRYLLAEAVRQGAFGLSMGLAYGHERVSTTEEIIDIAKILPQISGVLKLHVRSEGSGLLASINEAVHIGRETGASVQISHLKTIGKQSWRSFNSVLGLFASANASGVDINFDVSPYSTTGSLLYLLLPAWARQNGLAALFAYLDDPVNKAKVIEELGSYTIHPDRILIIAAKLKMIVGKTLAQIAREAEISAEEALVETVRANEGMVRILGRTVSHHNMTLAIRDPLSLVASDAEGSSQQELSSGDLVHPRSFGAFPHFWHQFVQEGDNPIAPELAIQKITSGPARKLGISQRGMLKEKNYADIAVFDPRIIRDRATYRDPFHYPVGVEWVIVNGAVAVAQGSYKGVRAGRALRKA
ncbi:MAG: amidohydrolase family protein [Candidatus Sungbacteria bacterium]|nr:amidohydrolase family protein [Candidatus Sungbacteria bacterium]